MLVTSIFTYIYIYRYACLLLLLMFVVSVTARFWVQMCLSAALCSSIISVSMVNAAKRSGHRPTNDGLG